MHRIQYHLLCHSISPAFLRHKLFNSFFIFSSQEFAQNLTRVEDVFPASLPSACSPVIRIRGRKIKLLRFIFWIEFSLVIVYLALKCSPPGKWAFAHAAGRNTNWYNMFGDLLIINKHISTYVHIYICTVPIYIKTLESVQTL